MFDLRHVNESYLMLMHRYIKEDVVWLLLRQLFTRDQMTQKLTTIGHCMAFNNWQSPYHTFSYRKPRNDKCKSIQTRKLINNQIMCKIMNKKQICITATNYNHWITGSWLSCLWAPNPPLILGQWWTDQDKKGTKQ